jgi:aminobenzoyl-glutamate transport protein
MPTRRAFLDRIEWLGNKLPDPAFLFVIALGLTWVASALLAPVEFREIDPRSLVAGGEAAPIRVVSQLDGTALARFLASMVRNFTDFPPLGVVLVALLGVGVAEHTGLIAAVLRALLRLTPAVLLTPMVLLVSILSHTAADAGYVLVIPLAGVAFAAAGRHPMAGIATAFAGVSGGFSASFLPSALDPLLQGFTQSAAQLIAPARLVNPLCNWGFTSASTLLILAVGWFITDRIIEPRLRALPLDPGADAAIAPISAPGRERVALRAALASVALAIVLLAAAAWPTSSPLRGPAGDLTGSGAPLMAAIVPLIFLLFVIPGTVYGYVAGTVRSHRDLVEGMSRSMSSMGHYLVMAFFAAQFTYAFRESNLGALVAVKGADLLQSAHVPGAVTLLGIIGLSASINVLIGSASAKWAVLAPIFVPMLMQMGLSPELTQAAYRIGDSSTNILTPLLPYFPLIVVYCQRWVKATGIGTLISLMVPYSIAFLVTWSVLLLVFWGTGLPLGLQAPYSHP